MAEALAGQTEANAGTGNAAVIRAEKRLEKFIAELENVYVLRPVISEHCNVTLTELDTIYSFQGLFELHTLLDVRNDISSLERLKADKK